LRYFNKAYNEAIKNNEPLQKANALHSLGICSYGTSLSVGLQFANKAMVAYQLLEAPYLAEAKIGRSKCLQLMSTIKSRQGEHKEALALSKKALQNVDFTIDSLGTLILIYTTIGKYYLLFNKQDSAAYYLLEAYKEAKQTNNIIYLPTTLLNLALLEGTGQAMAKTYIDRAISISEATQNVQAQVQCYLKLADWQLRYDANAVKALQSLNSAYTLASTLTDKWFLIESIKRLITIKKKSNQFKEALILQEQKNIIEDSIYSWEKQKNTATIEVQMAIAEKDNQLLILKKENSINTLYNILLLLGSCSLILLLIGVYIYFLRINKKNKALHESKEKIWELEKVQKLNNEKLLQNEIGFKENELTALTLQMVQKNELLGELKMIIEENQNKDIHKNISKLISSGFNHNKEWENFNAHFESVNKNFNSKILSIYNDISPNDLKLCALIKLNLSIKEMASILNISADSVKTARYRLRKKLNLQTEDNLTTFMMNI
jgi:DNA-binding CsgD family transcriptional regulator